MVVVLKPLFSCFEQDCSLEMVETSRYAPSTFAQFLCIFMPWPFRVAGAGALFVRSQTGVFWVRSYDGRMGAPRYVWSAEMFVTGVVTALTAIFYLRGFCRLV